MVSPICSAKLQDSIDVLCWPPWYEEKDKLASFYTSHTPFFPSHTAIPFLSVLYIGIPQHTNCLPIVMLPQLLIVNISFGWSSYVLTKLPLSSSKSFLWCINSFEYLLRVPCWIKPMYSQCLPSKVTSFTLFNWAPTLQL